MTYRELSDVINNNMTPEQQECDITVYITSTDEYVPTLEPGSIAYANSETNDVLDPDHPFIVI